MIWILGFFSLCLFYYGAYLWVNAYWFTRKIAPDASENKFPLITVLVPARNEEDNIENCLNSILAQDYPRNRFEIVVIDDHSTDGTVDQVRKLRETNPEIRLVELSKTGGTLFKKAALTAGIEQAEGEWMVTTDADCIMGKEWLRALAQFFGPETGMVTGPVELTTSSGNAFQEWQALEFMGLIAVGGASVRAGRPNMCNGANLAYRKSAFDSVNGFAGVDGTPSGDDEYLMHKLHASGKWKIRFAKDRKAIVRTPAQPDWPALRNQRVRWVSKSTTYQRKSITLTLILAYLGMLTFPLALIFGIFEPLFWAWFGAAFAFKILSEAIILFPAARFFGKLRALRWLPVEQFLHIAYVLWVGIAGNLSSYTWKGRKVK